MAFFVPETYAPVLLRKRAAELLTITGKCYRSNLDIERGNISMTNRLKMPWVLLLREPIVLLLTFYAALIYGVLYMLLRRFQSSMRMNEDGMRELGAFPSLGS
jgi:hypothetical protein